MFRLPRGVLIFRPAVVVSHESSGMLVTCKTGATYSYCLPLKKVSVRAVEERSNRTDGMTRSELAQNHMDMVTAQADHKELLVSIYPHPPTAPSRFERVFYFRLSGKLAHSRQGLPSQP
jgi:hypothetical protein